MMVVLVDGCYATAKLNDKIAWDCALSVMEWKINWLDVYCNLEVKIQWRKSTRNNLQDIGLNKLTATAKSYHFLGHRFFAYLFTMYKDNARS